MNCPRCNGYMMRDDFLDIEETGQCRFVAWRCLICGEVLDPVIMQHRKSLSEPMVDQARLLHKVHSLSGVRKGGTIVQHV